MVGVRGWAGGDGGGGRGGDLLHPPLPEVGVGGAGAEGGVEGVGI